MMKNYNGIKGMLIRALRTFGQAAIGYIVANIALIKWDDPGALKTTVMTVITAAVACGLAALMNLPVEPPVPTKEPETDDPDDDNTPSDNAV